MAYQAKQGSQRDPSCCMSIVLEMNVAYLCHSLSLSALFRFKKYPRPLSLPLFTSLLHFTKPYVNFKKSPCHPVRFKGQEPSSRGPLDRMSHPLPFGPDRVCPFRVSCARSCSGVHNDSSGANHFPWELEDKMSPVSGHSLSLVDSYCYLCGIELYRGLDKRIIIMYRLCLQTLDGIGKFISISGGTNSQYSEFLTSMKKGKRFHFRADLLIIIFH